MQKEDLLAAYDEARTELDRARLEAFMIRRRARLAALPVDLQAVAAGKARIAEAYGAVARTERAIRAAGFTPSRPNTQSAREKRRAQGSAA